MQYALAEGLHGRFNSLLHELCSLPLATPPTPPTKTHAATNATWAPNGIAAQGKKRMLNATGAVSESLEGPS